MPFHMGVFGNGAVYLTPPADVTNGTRAYVYILGDDEDPVSFYRRLVLIEPEDARLYNHLGLAQFEAGRLADAEASFNRAISLDFTFAEAHRNLGRCYARDQQPDAARLAYQKAADLAPEDAAAHRLLIGALVAADRPDEALAALATALAAVPRLRDWAESDDTLAPLRGLPGWADALTPPED